MGAADLDHDGDGHVVAATSNTDAETDLAWLENPITAAGIWSRREITGDFAGAETFAVADLDGDGNLDIAPVSFTSGKIVLRPMMAAARHGRARRSPTFLRSPNSPWLISTRAARPILLPSHGTA